MPKRYEFTGYRVTGKDYSGRPMKFYTLYSPRINKGETPLTYAERVALIKGFGKPQQLHVKRLSRRAYYDEQYGKGAFDRDILRIPTAAERMEKK